MSEQKLSRDLATGEGARPGFARQINKDTLHDVFRLVHIPIQLTRRDAIRRDRYAAGPVRRTPALNCVRHNRGEVSLV